MYILNIKNKRSFVQFVDKMVHFFLQGCIFSSKVKKIVSKILYYVYVEYMSKMYVFDWDIANLSSNVPEQLCTLVEAVPVRLKGQFFILLK